MSEKARADKLAPAEMQAATLTISSLGGIGGTAFTPIVNAPEVAILGVVRWKIAPVWDGKAFQPRLMLPLCLSYDHRVIDGAARPASCAISRPSQGHAAHSVMERIQSERQTAIERMKIRLPRYQRLEGVPVIEILLRPGQKHASGRSRS